MVARGADKDALVVAVVVSPADVGEGLTSRFGSELVELELPEESMFGVGPCASAYCTGFPSS